MALLAKLYSEWQTNVLGANPIKPNLITNVVWDEKQWNLCCITFKVRTEDNFVEALKQLWTSAKDSLRHILVAATPKVVCVYHYQQITELQIEPCPLAVNETSLSIVAIFDNIESRSPEVFQYLVPHSQSPTAHWGPDAQKGSSHGPLIIYAYDKSGMALEMLCKLFVLVGPANKKCPILVRRKT